MAPESSSIKQPFRQGTTVPMAGRFTPLMRLTMRVPPTTRAPVLPAETKASPSPSASICRPRAMLLSLYCFIIAVGSASMGITSGASAILIPSSEIPNFAAFSRSFSPSPVSMISHFQRSAAMRHPCNTASGALSPP